MPVACPGASPRAPSAWVVSVHAWLIWRTLKVLIRCKWWASMCAKPMMCKRSTLEGAPMSLHRCIFRVTFVLLCCWGKIIPFFFLNHWRFSLLLLVLPGSGLDFFREEIRFFVPFHSVSVYTNLLLSVHGSERDNLSLHTLLRLLFSNKLYLRVVLSVSLLVTAGTVKKMHSLSKLTQKGASEGLTWAISTRAESEVC